MFLNVFEIYLCVCTQLYFCQIAVLVHQVAGGDGAGEGGRGGGGGGAEEGGEGGGGGVAAASSQGRVAILLLLNFAILYLYLYLYLSFAAAQYFLNPPRPLLSLQLNQVTLPLRPGMHLPATFKGL